ncbi:MAG TPA: ATP-binding cassette domain-containing protein [Sphingobacterium sp.]|nr:ATP-binding cassette domain-containing protein [Sphingobacterium sp.]
MISFENIKKSYGERVILKDISAKIHKGKITALIGTNGAGKSTLLSIISRLIQKDGGKVSIYEKELSKYKNNELAKRLSILRQANQIDMKLTVRELVAFGRFPYSQGRLTKADNEIIDRAIDFSELSEYEHAYIDELSGGQRQRAFLAMVIAQDTEFILLDEPLNNLDLKHSIQMMKTLRKMVDELGKTIVIVIHEINFASHFADYIIAMKDAKIKYHLPTHEFITKNKLKEIFGIEFDIIEHNKKKICNYFNN